MSEPASPPEQPGQHDQHGQSAEHGPAQPDGTHHDGLAEDTEPPRERVALGLGAAVVALLVGAGITLAIWNFGFIASITSFVMAAGAVFLYKLAAGTPPRKGIVPLVVLVVGAVVATFFLLVGWDAATAYDELTADMPAEQIAMGKAEFVRTSIFDSEVLGAYTKDMLWFFGFAVLGMWSTLRNALGGATA